MADPSFPLTTTAEVGDRYRRAGALVARGDLEAAVRTVAGVVEADDAFALGHAALAVCRFSAGDRPAADAAIARALACAADRSPSRHERHHLEVVTAAVAGATDRAAALLREHLDDVGQDPVASAAVTAARTGASSR